ncbi:hypothetical protein EDE15_0711 [Edaphobacter aggregans]|uniref:Lipoprotein n=1 Tax=Edaphobacter aggregans TaxID=570835 RepID=A0A428MEE6_9BACT|nr:hypothetical protein [Edaphobacter aggregans]RSL15229.1 hypothetical protein EDE15_0711 [Edaphobacter aggregans]
MKFICLFSLLLSALGCNNRITSAHVLSSNHATTSTVSTGKEGDAVFPVVDNGKFYVLPDYHADDEKAVNLTLTEHIVTQVRTDQECCSSEITLTESINDKPTWILKKKATRADMFDRFYRTVSPGCCGSATRYAYFDLLTGNQSYIATEPIASLGLVGSFTLSRYLALNRLSEPGDELFVLQIQYGPQSGPSQIAYLTRSGEDIAADSTTVQYFKDGKLEPSTISGQDGTFPIDFILFPPGYPSNTHVSKDDINGLSFVLNVEGSHLIKIPLIKDHLDFSHAVLPKGFQISEALPAGFEKYLQEIRQ